MRIVALVFATIATLAVVGLSFLRVGTQFDHAKSLQEVEDIISKTSKATPISADAKKKMEGYKGKATRTKIGAVLFIVCGFACAFLLVLTFMKKTKLIYFGGLGLILLAVITLFVNPSYETGIMQAASARSIAYVVSIAAVIGALFSMGAEKLRQRKEARPATA